MKQQPNPTCLYVTNSWCFPARDTNDNTANHCITPSKKWKWNRGRIHYHFSLGPYCLPLLNKNEMITVLHCVFWKAYVRSHLFVDIDSIIMIYDFFIQRNSTNIREPKNKRYRSRSKEYLISFNINYLFTYLWMFVLPLCLYPNVSDVRIHYLSL